MKRKCIVFAAIGVIAVVLVAHAKSRVPHPKVEQIADTWIGYNEGDLYFYRLTLNTNGTGLCANTFVREPAKLYRVTKWTLDGYAIEVMLVPIDPDAEPIWMKGKTAGWYLNLEIGGKKLKWKRKFKLYRESDFLEKYEKVKARMQEAEQPAAQVQSEGAPSD